MYDGIDCSQAVCKQPHLLFAIYLLYPPQKVKRWTAPFPTPPSSVSGTAAWRPWFSPVCTVSSSWWRWSWIPWLPGSSSASLAPQLLWSFSKTWWCNVLSFYSLLHNSHHWFVRCVYQVVADMLMTLTIPVRVLSDAGVGSWRLRAFHCRYSAVLFYITMYISILLLGAISLDRYLKIVRPFGKCALQRVRVGQMLSGVIWVVMLLLAFPNVLLSNQPPPQTISRFKCTSMKSEAGMVWHEGLNYFCQVQQHQKVWEGRRGWRSQDFIILKIIS